MMNLQAYLHPDAALKLVECETARNDRNARRGAPVVDLANGVAVVGISGVLGPGSNYDTDLNKVASVMRDLDQADNVKSVVLLLDSLGGTVMGTPEAADAIANLSKPTIAWSGTMMGSAAYYLASAADVVMASRSSMVGSIGVVSVHVDMSRLMENMGVRIEKFTSDEFKAAGTLNTELTEAQRESIQRTVDHHAQVFKSFVRGRRSVSEENLNGEFIPSPVAMSRGLVDGLADNLSDVVDRAVALHSIVASVGAGVAGTLREEILAALQQPQPKPASDPLEALTDQAVRDGRARLYTR